MRLIRTICARIARDERGIALVVASGILLTLGILTAAVAAQVVEVNRVSNDDRSAKRALQAAEAGVQRAIHDVNKNILLGSGLCVAPTVNCGPVPTTPENVGNNATYQYYISPILTVNGAAGLGLGDCVGTTVTGAPLQSGTLTVQQRCVTSFGRSGRVTRRVQARIAAQSEFQVFPVGLTSRRRLCIAAPANDPRTNAAGCTVTGASTGNDGVNSDIAANEWIVMDEGGGDHDGGVPVCGDMFIERGALTSNPTHAMWSNCETAPFNPVAPSTYKCVSLPCPAPTITPLDNGFGPLPLDGVFAPVGGDTSGNNDNARLVTALVNQGCQANVLFDDRQLDIAGRCPNNATLTIPAGTYNVCRLNVGGQTLRTAGPLDPFPATNSTPVKFLVDSPYREGSGCDAGQPFIIDGTQRQGWNAYGTQSNPQNCATQGGPSNYSCADGSVTFDQQPANASGDSRAFQFWVYGNPVTNCPIATPNYPYAMECDTGPENEAPENVIDLENGGDLNLGVVAPWSLIRINNSGSASSTNISECSGPGTDPARLDVCGAFFAYDIDIKNGMVFREDVRFRDETIVVTEPVYYLANWNECPATPTNPSDPRSGC